MNWDDPAMLAVELAALPPLTNADVHGADVDWLIDAVHPGAPLLITFSYVTWKQEPPFYLFGRSKKWASMTGRPLNRIPLRDPGCQRWLRGAPTIGNDWQEVSDWLERWIGQMQPSRVVCVGNGIGGYAAIMFAMLLQTDHAFALNPLSLLDAGFARACHDPRHRSALEQLDDEPPAGAPRDWLRLASDSGYRGGLDVVYAAQPPALNWHSGSHDAVHAVRLGLLPGARLHPVGDAVDGELLRRRAFCRMLAPMLQRLALGVARN
jgi:hypothetical protein